MAQQVVSRDMRESVHSGVKYRRFECTSVCLYWFVWYFHLRTLLSLKKGRILLTEVVRVLLSQLLVSQLLLMNTWSQIAHDFWLLKISFEPEILGVKYPTVLAEMCKCFST